MLLYTGEYVSGDLNPTEENDDDLEVIEWFDKERINKIPLSPPLKKLLKQLKYKLDDESQI